MNVALLVDGYGCSLGAHGHRNCSAAPSGQAPPPLSRRAAGAGLDGESADRAIIMPPPRALSSDTVREIEYQILQLNRPPDLSAGPSQNSLFGVVELLHAESAADIGRDHPQFLLGDVEHEQAHEQPHHMRKLACRP